MFPLYALLQKFTVTLMSNYLKELGKMTKQIIAVSAPPERLDLNQELKYDPAFEIRKINTTRREMWVSKTIGENIVGRIFSPNHEYYRLILFRNPFASAGINQAEFTAYLADNDKYLRMLADLERGQNGR